MSQLSDHPPIPDWAVPVLTAPKVVIDGSAILADGGSPLEDVMAAAESLRAGEGFIVRAPFDPTPLRGMLEQMGLLTTASPWTDGHWRAFALRP